MQCNIKLCEINNKSKVVKDTSDDNTNVGQRVKEVFKCGISIVTSHFSQNRPFKPLGSLS